MAGHSKWHSIRHKKGANDAARGKIFTRHAKLITIAARQGGGDPDINPALRLEIERAKAVNTPNANIERAIKKGTGEDKNAAVLTELTYEGYGADGVAILIEALTDNNNRTLTNVRQAFVKNNGNIGESGSVAWMFHRKGSITIGNLDDQKAEELEMIAIEADAEDVVFENKELEITCDPKIFFDLKKNLESEDAEILNAEISMIAENPIEISSVESAQKILKLIEALEDDDDVSIVHSSANISVDILDQL